MNIGSKQQLSGVRLYHRFYLKSVLYAIFFLFALIAKQEANAQLPVSDSILLDFFVQRNIPVTSNNSLHIIHSGEDKFKDLFQYIEKAKHHVHLEYFNFRNDSIGNALFDLLGRKAMDGVEVRVICDAFGNWSNSRPLTRKKQDEIAANKIEFIIFDPLSFPYITHALHRNHRKNVIIDGKIAYVGGMNVADYYITGRPKIGNWYDTHLRIEGEAVKYLQRIFLDTWNEETEQDIEGSEYFPEPDSVFSNGKALAIVDRTPLSNPRLMRQTYVRAIQAAQYKIQIVNPYFLPTPTVRKELKKAVERGVKLEIMFSRKSDITFTPDGALRFAYKLVEKGAHVYLYEKGFKHSKVMMVDDSFCTIGSTNLDYRSLRYDYEINAFIFDQEATMELVQLFENDKANSTLLTIESKKKLSLWKRIVGWAANLLSPVL